LRGEENPCSVCGIDRARTSREELTARENKRLGRCRLLRFFGLFQLVVGALVAALLNPWTLSALSGVETQEPEPGGPATDWHFLAVGAALVVLGYGMWRLHSWSFYLAVLLYGTAALGSVVLSVMKPTGSGPFGVIILLVFLSIVAGPESRKILLRR
jgi:hypothetical protein